VHEWPYEDRDRCRLGFFADLWGNMIELAEVLPEAS
jgi:hypothetical protein